MGAPSYGEFVSKVMPIAILSSAASILRSRGPSDCTLGFLGAAEAIQPMLSCCLFQLLLGWPFRLKLALPAFAVVVGCLVGSVAEPVFPTPLRGSLSLAAAVLADA